MPITIHSSRGAISCGVLGTIMEIVENGGPGRSWYLVEGKLELVRCGRAPSDDEDEGLQFYAEQVVGFGLDEQRLFWQRYTEDFDILDVGLVMTGDRFEGPCKGWRYATLKNKIGDAGCEPTPLQKSFLEWYDNLTEEEQNDDRGTIFETRKVFHSLPE